MNKFMQLAIEEAKNGILHNHGGPFGCVIVKDGNVVASAHNEVIKNNDPTCHGEMQAIREACSNLKTFDLKGCELYTTGYPCPMCFGAILWANIDRVYYGCNTSDTDSILGFRDKQFEDKIPNLRNTMCEEVERQSCIELYMTYMNSKNKQLY